MTDIIASLATLAGRYDALFCDLWGCLHNGHAPYPAAVAALQAFRRTGGRVVLLTNAPRPARFVIATLDRMGVPRDAWDLVVSSGDAAQYAMLHGAVGHRVWHLGPAKDDGFFTDYPPEFAGDHIEKVSLEEAEGIVCTGPFDELAEVPERIRQGPLVALALRNGGGFLEYAGRSQYERIMFLGKVSQQALVDQRDSDQPECCLSGLRCHIL